MTDRFVRTRAAGIAVFCGLAVGASAMPPLPPDETPREERAVSLATTVEPDPNEQPESAPPEPGGAAVPVTPPEPAGRFAWLLDGWVRRIELGASGTEGNSQTGTFRGSVQLTRKEGLNEFFADATYERASRESETTQDRLAASARYDRLMADSRWRYFATGTYESDRFRDWNHRWTSGGGFGYQAVREGETSLLARGGMSLAQDVGGVDEDLRTEAILGMDVTHKIDDRQRITGSIDFLPNVSDLDEFRINARAGWEFLVDPESNLSLRIGGEDRYDATATGGSERNDLSYYAVIAVEF